MGNDGWEKWRIFNKSTWVISSCTLMSSTTEFRYDEDIKDKLIHELIEMVYFSNMKYTHTYNTFPSAKFPRILSRKNHSNESFYSSFPWEINFPTISQRKAQTLHFLGKHNSKRFDWKKRSMEATQPKARTKKMKKKLCL